MDIEINDLSKAIIKQLQEYSAEIDNLVHKETERTAKEVLSNLKSDSTIPQRTGEYRRKFYMKSKTGVGYSRYIIANRKYQITHLLERPHKIKNWYTGRTYGMSRAYPHWAKAQKTADKMYSDILERLKNGTL